MTQLGKVFDLEMVRNRQLLSKFEALIRPFVSQWDGLTDNFRRVLEVLPPEDHDYFWGLVKAYRAAAGELSAFLRAHRRKLGGK